MLSEVSDNSNQAFGLALLGTAWGTGYIVGPAISGALADPIGQYNLTITSKFIIRSGPRWKVCDLPLEGITI